ncbi:MAG TPA: hypothetical protein DEQ27_05380 [Prevotella sp.]|nr:hypothetical protein [Prevotella sp.]
MRKILLFCYLSFITLLLGCNNDDQTLTIVDGVEQQMPSSQSITQKEALEIASKVIKHSSITRNQSEGIPSFEYVLNETKTRTNGTTAPDTLAYIINYPNNNGFVIVSTTRNVYPVLGFSDKGNFSFDNEIVKSNFIDNLGAYIS